MEFMAFASSSQGNLYQVRDAAGSRLLIECGLSIQEIKTHLDFDLSGIAGCLLTHAHRDHARAAGEIMKAGIDLYCSQGTVGTLGLQGHRLHVVAAQARFSLGPWTVLPFATEHDVAEPLGFLIANGDHRLLFATDTYFVKPRFAGLTHIAVECNWSHAALAPDLNTARKKRLMASHMGLHTLKDFFTANDLKKVREIHLLHLSDDNSDEVRFERDIQALTGKPVFIAPRRQDAQVFQQKVGSTGGSRSVHRTGVDPTDSG